MKKNIEAFWDESEKGYRDMLRNVLSVKLVDYFLPRGWLEGVVI